MLCERTHTRETRADLKSRSRWRTGKYTCGGQVGGTHCLSLGVKLVISCGLVRNGRSAELPEFEAQREISERGDFWRKALDLQQS